MFSRHSRIIPQSSNDASHILNYANQRPLLRKPEVCNHHLHIDSYWLRVAQAAHTIIRLRSGSTHANKTQRCSTEKSRTGRLEHVQPEILSEENGPRNMTLLMKADAGRGRAGAIRPTKRPWSSRCLEAVCPDRRRLDDYVLRRAKPTLIKLVGGVHGNRAARSVSVCSWALCRMR